MKWLVQQDSGNRKASNGRPNTAKSFMCAPSQVIDLQVTRGLGWSGGADLCRAGPLVSGSTGTHGAAKTSGTERNSHVNKLRLCRSLSLLCATSGEKNNGPMSSEDFFVHFPCGRSTLTLTPRTLTSMFMQIYKYCDLPPHWSSRCRQSSLSSLLSSFVIEFIIIR